MPNQILPDRRVGNPAADSYHQQRVAKLVYQLQRGIRKFTCDPSCSLDLAICPKCWSEGYRGVTCACHLFTADQAVSIRAAAERIITVDYEGGSVDIRELAVRS